MGRWFNTAGPCLPEYHYMIPALRRLPEAPRLVSQLGYFVVHAPRQTGKTTAVRALGDDLTASGEYVSMAFTCEIGRAAGDDYHAAIQGVVQEIRSRAEVALPPELRPPPWPQDGENLLKEALAAWARACPRPLVLFFDEIDALRGQSLISVLSQLRAGYNERPADFPASVVLCGLRDVRDYKAAAGGDPRRLGTASPFNIKLKSLRVGDFTAAEVAELYGQHTADTGQEFTADAVARAFELTGGQPWLVNALAKEIVEEISVPTAEPITVEHVEAAKERLILARATHLDSLAARLAEPRVRRVIEPVLAGTLAQLEPYDDDTRYVRDLGLVASSPPVRIANPIYHEVIVRVLGSAVEENVLADPRSFVLPDGRFDIDLLLREFAAFWRENGELLTAGMIYHEVAPQLVLMGYLQRVVNGGGTVTREYGLGRGRIDLLIEWPYRTADGKRSWQREAIELKVWRTGEPDPLDRGLAQLDGYLDRLGLDHGVLVVFDRRAEAAPITDRTGFAEHHSPAGRPVTLLRG
ncbi:AAA family ATPase [Natronosporangium hydrolyticum]|uniref:AAA family ATPase n=1 Tax=Natronosporangium hydrolyticum TaxID=2811111 RepID=A0A895YQT3_9ACTN|nr:AAA family ATPase [Natronosporangium hydrolyticum]QSB16368.1 AAA family ATPase [Natronosporangium hydrolyticum]